MERGNIDHNRWTQLSKIMYRVFTMYSVYTMYIHMVFIMYMCVVFTVNSLLSNYNT
jgi:hypothetical protein